MSYNCIPNITRQLYVLPFFGVTFESQMGRKLKEKCRRDLSKENPLRERVTFLSFFLVLCETYSLVCLAFFDLVIGPL